MIRRSISVLTVLAVVCALITPATAAADTTACGVSFLSIAGANRFDTAIKASQKAYPNGADTVVIATGENWPDALGGAALAGSVDGPLLLTPTGSLPDEVRSEIDRLGARNAYILGGSKAVSPAVQTMLDQDLSGSVTRLAGADRYETASKVASAVMSRNEVGMFERVKVFVATGENFPDALAASPVAAAKGMPIILMRPDERAGLTLSKRTVVILGGTGAVTAKTEASLKSAYGADYVTRLGGSERYDTAAKIASYGISQGMRWTGVGIATGSDFPDALSGGAMCGAAGSVLLLTDPNTLSAPAQTKLNSHKDKIMSLYFIGGTGAVSQGVRDRVAQVLK
jgi:putative cell wall-binding protein